MVHSFCLDGGWPLTFSCYSTILCQFVTEIISLTSVYLKEKVWQVVTFWERLNGLVYLAWEINSWRKEHETITNTKLEQVCYSIGSHTLQLAGKISKQYYYIADMLCDRNMNICWNDFFFFSYLYAKYF